MSEIASQGGTNSADREHESDRAKDRQLELVKRQAVGCDGYEEACHNRELKEDGEPLTDGRRVKRSVSSRVRLAAGRGARG